MPSSSNTKAAGDPKAHDSNEYRPPSDSELCQDWGGFSAFMQSCGLDPWNPYDVPEGRAILEVFRDLDRDVVAELVAESRNGNGTGGASDHDKKKDKRLAKEGEKIHTDSK